MIRKALIGIGLLAVGSYMWVGTCVRSYTQTGVQEVQHYFQGQVPVEFEIARARQLARDLVPDIRKTRQNIAEEEVRIERLRKEIAQSEQNLEGERVAIMVLRDQLSQGRVSYNVGGQTYTAQAMQNELNRRFGGYKQVDSTLKTKREILTSRETALQGVRGQYEGLVENRDKLEAELAALEARHKLNESRKIQNRYQVDDSQLSKLRGLIDAINDRVAVDEKLSQEEGNLDKRIPVEQLPPKDLGDQIDSYFGKDDKASPTAL